MIGIFHGSGILLSDQSIIAQFALPILAFILIVSKLLVPYLLLIFIHMILVFPFILLFGATVVPGILFYLTAAAVSVLLLPTIPFLSGTIIGNGMYYTLRNPPVFVSRLKTMFAGAFLFTLCCLYFGNFRYRYHTCPALTFYNSHIHGSFLTYGSCDAACPDSHLSKLV
ncbi:hypothetical protein C823_001339 [Eubacterium plexicaudatum ASF492]|nr:hypothetical protein C823_001339 [Eubacterium plexicaudatum ASF492]